MPMPQHGQRRHHLPGRARRRTAHSPPPHRRLWSAGQPGRHLVQRGRPSAHRSGSTPATPEPDRASPRARPGWPACCQIRTGRRRRAREHPRPRAAPGSSAAAAPEPQRAPDPTRRCEASNEQPRATCDPGPLLPTVAAARWRNRPRHGEPTMTTRRPRARLPADRRGCTPPPMTRERPPPAVRPSAQPGQGAHDPAATDGRGAAVSRFGRRWRDGPPHGQQHASETEHDHHRSSSRSSWRAARTRGGSGPCGELHGPLGPHQTRSPDRGREPSTSPTRRTPCWSRLMWITSIQRRRHLGVQRRPLQPAKRGQGLEPGRHVRGRIGVHRAAATLVAGVHRGQQVADLRRRVPHPPPAGPAASAATAAPDRSA